MADLYEKCEHCKGKEWEHHAPMFGPMTNGRTKCPLCDGVGFVAVGVTTAQVDRWGCWERALNGDPGLNVKDRLAALEYILSRLEKRDYTVYLPEKRVPAGKCDRCGACWYFQGVFSAPAFEQQAERFKVKHTSCPLSIDGGGI